VLENFCVAVRDFDFLEAEKYISDDEGYFANAKALAQGLSSEKAEIAKDVFSYMSFSDFSEEDGVCTVTVKRVDFYNLKKDVEFRASVGDSATEVLRELLESKGFAAKYIKTIENVKVSVRKNATGASVPLGHASENSDFTALLGLDTFLGWYTLQE
jgi:hypothetical protein